MCGILLVQSRVHVPLAQHQAALDIIGRRGPDLVLHRWVTPTVFVAQSVLHITGSDQFYHDDRTDTFAYNGEIYDYQWFGDYSNDVELAYATARSRPQRFRYYEGTWAWVLANHGQLLWASDPQGEKSLYMYQDADWLIVSSDVAAILTYVPARSVPVPYVNRCWSMIAQTPWHNITRCEPGRLYRNGKPAEQLDSVWSWINPNQVYYAAEFEEIWHRACKKITPNQPANISFSGGLDSSLILATMPNLEPIIIDCVDKDSIVAELPQAKISLDAESWAQHYCEMIRQTRMPAESWSHVGKWLVARHSTHRIVFTGLAADELFGGYPHHVTGSVSPYSQPDHMQLWQRCVDVYQGDCQQAGLLMDYWYQVVGVDAPGSDRMGGQWGREIRNPFMMSSVIKYALNLPYWVKVGKQPLRRLYHKLTGQEFVKPKLGFAGHANDSLPWLGVNIASTGNRHLDWQAIAQATFYEHCKT